jgi:hypothetical protein
MNQTEPLRKLRPLRGGRWFESAFLQQRVTNEPHEDVLSTAATLLKDVRAPAAKGSTRRACRERPVQFGGNRGSHRLMYRSVGDHAIERQRVDCCPSLERGRTAR